MNTLRHTLTNLSGHLQVYNSRTQSIQYQIKCITTHTHTHTEQKLINQLPTAKKVETQEILRTETYLSGHLQVSD